MRLSGCIPGPLKPPHNPLWERACSRKRCVSHLIRYLAHRLREQARSHRGGGTSDREYSVAVRLAEFLVVVKFDPFDHIVRQIKLLPGAGDGDVHGADPLIERVGNCTASRYCRSSMSAAT